MTPYRDPALKFSHIPYSDPRTQASRANFRRGSLSKQHSYGG